MDIGLIIAVLSLVGMVGTLASGIAEYNKTNWCFALMTSVTMIALPFYTARALESMAGQFFLPHIAHTVASVAVLVLFIGGAIGVVACLVTGIKWLRRESRLHEVRSRGIDPKRYTYRK